MLINYFSPFSLISRWFYGYLNKVSKLSDLKTEGFLFNEKQFCRFVTFPAETEKNVRSCCRSFLELRSTFRTDFSQLLVFFQERVWLVVCCVTCQNAWRLLNAHLLSNSAALFTLSFFLMIIVSRLSLCFSLTLRHIQVLQTLFSHTVETNRKWIRCVSFSWKYLNTSFQCQETNIWGLLLAASLVSAHMRPDLWCWQRGANNGPLIYSRVSCTAAALRGVPLQILYGPPVCLKPVNKQLICL